MNKNCENKNCSERGFKKVLVKDKKNREYKVLCIFHYEKYIKKQNLNCDWDLCDQLGEFKAPANFFHKLWNNAIEDELLNISKFKKSISQENQGFTEKQIIALKKMELKPNISWFGIKEQFKKLVKKYHPDMNSGDKKYEEKLKEITIAYSYLKTSLSEKQKVIKN